MTDTKDVTEVFWKNRLLIVFGILCVVASNFLPTSAQLLGELGTKIVSMALGITLLGVSDPKKIVRRRKAKPAPPTPTPPKAAA